MSCGQIRPKWTGGANHINNPKTSVFFFKHGGEGSHGYNPAASTGNIIKSFSLRAIFSFVASGLESNGCMLSYLYHYYLTIITVKIVLLICLLDLVHVVLSVLIGHVWWADVQLEVGPKIFKIIIVWKLWKDIISMSDEYIKGVRLFLPYRVVRTKHCPHRDYT